MRKNLELFDKKCIIFYYKSKTHIMLTPILIKSFRNVIETPITNFWYNLLCRLPIPIKSFRNVRETPITNFWYNLLCRLPIPIKSFRNVRETPITNFWYNLLCRLQFLLYKVLEMLEKLP